MLPILKSEVQKIEKPIFGEYVLILIQHLLRDSISLIEAFTGAGANPSDMFIIGIPYSSKADVVNELKKTFKVFTPSFPIDEKIIDVVEHALKTSKEKGKKLLIIEDGGYAVPVIHGWITETRNDGGYTKLSISKKHKETLKYCMGAVEQTAQGVWRDKEIELKIPVLTIASSKLKKVLEAPEVGNAVVRNIQELLSQRGEFIRGRNVSLIGYGTIGSEIATALRNNGAVVTVADIDSINLVGARFDGFYTDSRMNLVARSNIIIGATGRCSIGKKAILKISESGKDVVLVNASSKRVEIDVDTLEDLKETKIATKIGTDYQMPEGNKILLLAEGYPVNFYGGSESIPDGIMDVILTELFLCAKKLVNGNFSPGIYENEVIDEKALAELFHSLYFS